MYILISSTDLSETFLILRRTEGTMIKSVCLFSYKVTVILVRNLNFLESFSKILKYQTSRISVQWEPKCSMRRNGRTDGRTDVTKLIVAFRNFANAPKN